VFRNISDVDSDSDLPPVGSQNVSRVVGESEVSDEEVISTRLRVPKVVIPIIMKHKATVAGPTRRSKRVRK
jgi:hypothetical protein